MGWVVRDENGDDVPFATHDEAVAFEREMTGRDTRTPDEVWAQTVRPLVSRETFDRRITMGWEPVRAASTTPEGRYSATAVRNQDMSRLAEQVGGPGSVLHEVLGRRRTIKQWSTASGYSESAIRHGIRRYGTLQAYFLNTGWYPGKPTPIVEEID